MSDARFSEGCEGCRATLPDDPDGWFYDDDACWICPSCQESKTNHQTADPDDRR